MIKKITSLFLLYFLSTGLSISQNPFSVAPTFFESRIESAIFQIDGSLYVVAGNKTSGDNYQRSDLWKFDPTPEIPLAYWQNLGEIPGDTRAGSVAFVLNGYGYFGTGTNTESDANHFKDFYRFDPSDNSITRIADYPAPITGGFSFVLNGRAFVGGGFVYFKDPNIIDEPWLGLREYIPSTDSWVYAPSLPANFVNSIAFNIGGKAYVGMGNHHANFYEYDLANNTWTLKTTFPGAGSGRVLPVGFSSAQYGYVGAGRSLVSSSTYYNDLWRYDPSTNSWSQKTNIPGPARKGMIGTFLNGEAYLGFGGNEEAWYKYSPACDFVSYLLTGADLVCTSANYSNQNLPEGSSINWTSSNPGGLSINSAGVATRVNNFHGVVTVSSNISGCGTRTYSKTVTVGTPAPTINYTEVYVPNKPYRYDFTATLFPGATYKWYVNGVLQGGTSNTLSVSLPCGITKSVKCYQINTCGQSGFSNEETLTGECGMMMSISPNPATTELTVSDESISDEIDAVTLFNSNQEKVYSSKTAGPVTKIPVDNLPEGLYFLQVISKKGAIKQKRIVVKK